MSVEELDCEDPKKCREPKIQISTSTKPIHLKMFFSLIHVVNRSSIRSRFHQSPPFTRCPSPLPRLHFRPKKSNTFPSASAPFPPKFRTLNFEQMHNPCTRTHRLHACSLARCTAFRFSGPFQTTRCFSPPRGPIKPLTPSRKETPDRVYDHMKKEIAWTFQCYANTVWGRPSDSLALWVDNQGFAHKKERDETRIRIVADNSRSYGR